MYLILPAEASLHISEDKRLIGRDKRVFIEGFLQKIIGDLGTVERLCLFDIRVHLKTVIHAGDTDHQGLRILLRRILRLSFHLRLILTRKLQILCNCRFFLFFTLLRFRFSLLIRRRILLEKRIRYTLISHVSSHPFLRAGSHTSLQDPQAEVPHFSPFP